MKKFAIGLAAAISVIIMCFALAACGSSIEGTYKFSSMSYSDGGTSIEIKAGEQFMGLITINADAMVLEINEDGTVNFTISMLGENSVEIGSWEKRSGNYYITFADEEQEVTVKGNKLTISQEMSGMNAQIVLEKQ